MANRRIGQAGLALIKQFEGCRLIAYQCSAGVWTIGYGHTAGVYKGMKITQAQADAFLKQDIAKFEKYINNPSYVPFTDKLNQNQFDALVSFAFNLGQGNVKNCVRVERSIRSRQQCSSTVRLLVKHYRDYSGEEKPKQLSIIRK